MLMLSGFYQQRDRDWINEFAKIDQHLKLESQLIG